MVYQNFYVDRLPTPREILASAVLSVVVLALGDEVSLPRWLRLIVAHFFWNRTTHHLEQDWELSFWVSSSFRSVSFREFSEAKTRR